MLICRFSDYYSMLLFLLYFGSNKYRLGEDNSLKDIKYYCTKSFDGVYIYFYFINDGFVMLKADVSLNDAV